MYVNFDKEVTGAPAKSKIRRCLDWDRKPVHRTLKNMDSLAYRRVS